MATIKPICNPVVSALSNCDPDKAPTIFGNFVTAIVSVMLTIASLWAFFELLRGGFEWVTSGGDKGKIAAARERLLHAIIGLIIIFSVWSLYIVVLKFLGISSGDGFEFKLPTLIQQ